PKGDTGVVVDTEHGMEVRVGYATREPVSDVGFAVDIRREDGTRVYGTNTFLEAVVLPSPLPERGTVRLVIDRVGLCSGRYTLVVSARSSSGTVHATSGQPTTFEVRSAIADEGMARPPHRWVIEQMEPLRNTAS
ncbi:Wzt carbohydrate-binding domain-containing protein, partial [Archangium sp.]|uniref:Wzt carbohydrate-binding domain-containing protein n=1 Tax=Archangium sp. TaxID=1872627 RepID=UPI002ED9BA40